MNLVWKYAKKHTKLLWLSIVLALINQLFSLLDPQLMRIIIDEYATSADVFGRPEYLRGIGLLLLGIVGVAFVSRLAKAFQDYFVNVVTESIGTDLYADGVAHVFSLPFSAFEDERSGSILLNLQKARDDTKAFIASLINVVFLSLVGIVFVIVYAFFVHWSIAVTFLALIPIVAVTTLLLSRRIKDAQAQIVMQSADLSGSTTETLRNVGLVKALGLETQEVQRLNDVNQEILSLELRKVKLLRTLTFIQGTLVNLVRVAVLFVTLALIWFGLITIGEFTIFIFYTFYVFNPLYSLAEVVANFQKAKASSEELERILSLPKSDYEPGDVRVETIKEIEFTNVSYTYHGSQEVSIKDVSFKVGEGETLAFVGPSGSGKSTLIKILVGLYRPETGDVRINNTSAEEISFDSFRSHFGFVAQETQLFSGTIRDNLLFVKPEASDEELVDVLHKSSADSLLERGNEKTGIGLSARIGETGIKLSGGERQRLAIARALLRNPDLLIFDEATSALDSLTESEIIQTIQDIREKNPHLVMIVVAHRLSTVQHADTILVLKNGSVVERGNHNELVSEDGLYRAMWKEQTI
jgi:ATP-binding cassette subfamily B protein